MPNTGQTTTGTLKFVVVSSGEMGGSTTTTGNYTVTGLDAFTSLEYKDFTLVGSSEFDDQDELVSWSFNMSSTLVLVSDDLSGTFGFSVVNDSEGDTDTAVSKLMGADDSIYVDTSVNDVSTCTLNGESVTCF